MGRISGIYRLAAILAALLTAAQVPSAARAVSANAAAVEHTSMTVDFQDQHSG
jgi:hypothetical protein